MYSLFYALYVQAKRGGPWVVVWLRRAIFGAAIWLYVVLSSERVGPVLTGFTRLTLRVRSSVQHADAAVNMWTDKKMESRRSPCQDARNGISYE